MNKKSNFSIKLVCKDLKLEKSYELYAAEIGKLIKENEKVKKKATVNNYGSDFIITMYNQWEAGMFTVPGRNGIESFAKFLHNTYNFPKKNKKKGFLSLESIKSMLYELQD